MTALNANKSKVDDALASLAALSGQLAKGDAAITNGIDAIGPAVSVLASENQDFSNLLTAANNLSDVADSIVTKSSSSILATIHQLYAVVNQMVGVESQLGPTLTDLAKFETLTKQVAPGNYLQLSLERDREIVNLTCRFSGRTGANVVVVVRLRLDDARHQRALGSGAAVSRTQVWIRVTALVVAACWVCPYDLRPSM